MERPFTSQVKGKKTPQNNLFVVKVSTKKGNGPTKIYPVVPTIVSKGAVIRNKLKRRLRAVAKTYFKDLGEKKKEVKIIARKGAAEMSLQQLEKDVKDAIDNSYNVVRK